MQLMQLLPGAAHQVLALGKGEGAIALEAGGQLEQPFGLGRRATAWGLPQLARQEGVKGLAAPLQIGEASVGLQQQPLLERAKPGLRPQRGAAGGIGGWALS